MSEISMYAPKAETSDIFKALKKLKAEEFLPEEGIFNYFYQHSLYPGISFFLKHRKRVKFFYVDHDDFILSVKDQKPDWNISIDQNIVRISLLFSVHDSEVQINFIFDVSDSSYRELLETVRKNKEIKVYYLMMLYGGLVFDSYVKIKIPQKIADVLKRIK